MGASSVLPELGYIGRMVGSRDYILRPMPVSELADSLELVIEGTETMLPEPAPASDGGAPAPSITSYCWRCEELRSVEHVIERWSFDVELHPSRELSGDRAAEIYAVLSCGHRKRFVGSSR